MKVIWYNQAFGNWDSGLLASVFEKHPTLFEHINSKELVYAEKAIIVIVGKPDIPPLRQYLETFKSGIVILTSEEDSYFDWKSAIPPHLEIWTQYFQAATKAEIKDRLLIGAPYRIKDYKINRNDECDRKYLWSFVGQLQNPFRLACVDVLSRLPDGFMRIVEGFGGQGESGMDYQEYLDIMCNSKYVICPSGSMVVDSFRVYEAIECGAIPITEPRCPRDPEGYNWWNDVYPKHQLLLVDKWTDLPAILERPVNFPLQADIDNHWYHVYKRELEEKLLYAANKD